MGSASSASQSRAFNLGCQARIEGRPLSGNPYQTHSDGYPERMYVRWRQGWKHTDFHWGKGTDRYVRPLPEVLDVA